jgi:hypothetical protein
MAFDFKKGPLSTNKAVNRKRDCYSSNCSVSLFVSNKMFCLSVILLLAAAAFLPNVSAMSRGEKNELR